MNWRPLVFLAVLALLLPGLPPSPVGGAYAFPGEPGDCLLLKREPSGDRFVNNCGVTVTLVYCAGTDCTGWTGTATLPAGGSTPVTAAVPGGSVSYGACLAGYGLATQGPGKLVYTCFPPISHSSASHSPAASATAQPPPPSFAGDARNEAVGVGTGRGGEAELSPLRSTATLEAHNPANEASDCLEPIDSSAYDARGVKSVTNAVFRNTCAYPVEARWCVGATGCAKGYDNAGTMPANADKSISYVPPSDGTKTIHWAACRNGFAYRADFAGTLQYACK